ncbi:MAG: DUF2442 domain-containing protein [Myxococcaceae bacterium]
MGLPLKKVNEYPAITDVCIEGQSLAAVMSDGREISIPIAWFPKLMNATIKQQTNIEISPGGYGIHWPEIDEDISIKAFIDGI